MRYLLALLALLTVAACSDDLTRPTTLTPVDTEAWAYTPYYPDAPYCPDGTNGAFLVRVHSYWTHAPASLTITPTSTAQQRKLQAEVYSYIGSTICRNMTDLVTWTVQDAPSSPLVTAIDGTYQHIRITKLMHIGFGDGVDRTIAAVGPKQLPGGGTTSGVAADTVKIIMDGF